MLTVLRQIDLGQDRRDAFLALRERNESDSLKSFVAAQLQAEELGVPLSEALNDIATDMRRMANQNARRQAQRAEPARQPAGDDPDRPGLDDPDPALDVLQHAGATGRQPLWRISRRRLEGRGADGAGGWLGSACRLILNVRAGILLITLLLAAARRSTAGWSTAAIVVAGIASLVPVLRWEQVGPAIVRHPSYLAGELVLAALILVLTGVDSPFFFFTLGTALLGGLVYGYPGAALFSVMLMIVYAYAIHMRAPFDDDAGGLPHARRAAGAVPDRGRRRRGRAARCWTARPRPRRRSPTQERTLAVQAERERLARDMHDSLAKTVHGIGFAALALSRRIKVDPAGAVEDARKLAVDARTAAQEARELLSGLRGRDDAELPLPTAIRSEAARWGERTGHAVGGSLDDVGPLPSLALRELRWILKEALANVERYAHATRVDIHLRRLGERVVLTVADDGDGFEAPDDLETLEAVGSFGLRGMRERARLAGGDLSVESEPGEGCVISVWVPARRAGAPARGAGAAAARRRRPIRVRGGAVEGFTWQ